MEVYVESGGEQRLVEIGEKSTVGDVKAMVKEMFCYRDVELEVEVEGKERSDGEVLSTLGVQEGEVVRVKLGRYIPKRLMGWVPVEGVRCIAVSETLMVGVGTGNDGVQLYDCSDLTPSRMTPDLAISGASSLKFSPCGTLLMVVTDSAVHLATTDPPSIVYSSPGTSRVTAAAVSAGYVYHCTKDTTTAVDYEGRVIKVFPFGGCCAEASPEGGCTAVATFGKKVYVVQGEETVICFESVGLVKMMCFLKEGLVLLSADAIKVFSLRHNIVVQKLNPYPYSSLVASSYLHDAVVITKGRSAYVADHILDTQLTATTNSIIRCLAVPSYGDFFVTGGQSATYIHDLRTGCELSSIDSEAAFATTTLFGNFIVTATRHSVSVWF